MRNLALWIVVGLLGLLVPLGGCSGSGGGSGGTGGSGATGGSGGGTPLLDEYVLEDQALVPESGSFDPVDRAFYVGSATEGSITRVDADGTETLFFEPMPSESLRTLGITIDAQARRLWVCVDDSGSAGVGGGGIWTFDLGTGDLEMQFDLTTAGENPTCNDIALDSEGVAYVSDSANPRIYRANPEDGVIETWADDPLLSPDGGAFGGNGIAVTEDDQYVMLSKTFATTMTPRLLRIERADPSNISGITTTPALDGVADGMSFLDGDLYIAIVSNGAILRLTSDDDWQTAAITATPGVSGTSTVRPAEGRLYGIYSDITNAITTGNLNPPFLIYRIDLDSFE